MILALISECARTKQLGMYPCHVFHPPSSLYVPVLCRVVTLKLQKVNYNIHCKFYLLNMYTYSPYGEPLSCSHHINTTKSGTCTRIDWVSFSTSSLPSSETFLFHIFRLESYLISMLILLLMVLLLSHTLLQWPAPVPPVISSFHIKS